MGCSCCPWVRKAQRASRSCALYLLGGREVPPNAPPGSHGPDGASLWSALCFSWVSPLIKKGNVQSQITLEDVLPHVSGRMDAFFLDAEFEEAKCALYGQEEGSHGADEAPQLQRGFLTRLLLRLYGRRMIRHTILGTMESAFRVASPLFLRRLLSALRENNTGDAWLFGMLMVGSSLGHVLSHHRVFWDGFKLGVSMRIQTSAAVHRKALKLRASTVESVSTGQLINLLSNDMQRFDDAMVFYIFILVGPLELLGVLVALSSNIGWAAASAGLSILLLLVPLQASLVKFIGNRRHQTALFTDKRVRTLSEVFTGILATKMYGWELPFRDVVGGLRQKEMQQIQQGSYVKAFNMTAYFVSAQLAATIAFLTAWGMGRTFSVDEVFSSLALFYLPRLTMANFFVAGVERTVQLMVSIRRLENFFMLPEALKTFAQKTERVPTGQDTNNDVGPEANHQKPVINIPPTDVFYFEEDPVKLERDGQSTRAQASKEDSLVGRRVILKGIQLELTEGELVGVFGTVGSGKSTLLAAILGEARVSPHKENGAPPPNTVSSRCDVVEPINGTCAYCSQVPWIMEGTVRDNICFLQDFDSVWYKEVIEACALDEDLKSLPAGDETELGERGINLSGGQKARVALARAAYSRASVILLDDPLSAVDSKVLKILWKKCICGVMSGSTRIVVSHQRAIIPDCDRVLILRDGYVKDVKLRADAVCQKEDGTEANGATSNVQLAISELESMSKVFQSSFRASRNQSRESLASHGSSQSLDMLDKPKETEHVTKSSAAVREGSGPRTESSAKHKRVVSFSKDGDHRVESDDLKEDDYATDRGMPLVKHDSSGRRSSLATSRTMSSQSSQRSSSRTSRRNFSIVNRNFKLMQSSVRNSKGKLVQEESRESGAVTWKTYLAYFRYMGLHNVVIFLLLLVVGQCIVVALNLALAIWGGQDEEDQSEDTLAIVVGSLAAGLLVVCGIRSVAFFYMALRASRSIHDDMSYAILRAPLSFFHTNPLGRVLNRFSKDLGIADEFLPWVTYDFFQCLSHVVATVILICVAVPYMIAIAALLLVVFLYLREFFLATARDLKRFEAISRSPVFATFGAAIKGLPVIRAFGASDRFHKHFLSILNENGHWSFCFLVSNRWLGFRLDMISFLLLAVTVIFSVALRSSISDTDILGLALVYVLEMAGLLQWCTRQSAELENSMTSIERTIEYSLVLPGDRWVIDGAAEVPPDAFQNGALEYKSVSAIYRPGLPLVLNQMTFRVEGGQSCGIVGRTGGGKSTLMLALYQLIEIVEGQVLVDGHDLANYGADSIRSYFAIIPQEPTLYAQTVRFNLDPFEEHTDDTLWAVLQTVSLRQVVTGMEAGLYSNVSEGGSNLSVGERQLLCLARALLRKAVIIAMDEATANVDPDTDYMIQDAMRTHTENASFLQPVATNDGDAPRQPTRLIIAHRLDTVMSCDTIVAVNQGRIVEQGSPSQLLNEGGTFATMVDALK